MAWSTREKAPLAKSPKKDTPSGLWEKCTECGEVVFRKDFVANLNVCPKCNHHYYMPAEDRIANLMDPGTFEEADAGLCSSDPLEFKDSKAYRQRLRDMHTRTGRYDAIITGRGLLNGRPVNLGVFDFEFMGGSMGSVVGERLARLFQRAAEAREPAVVVSSSGGARMQEGILSLMQMAKTCAALAKMREAGVPFISILTHPTTGGVAASFAMLGDINIAEPKALIGFAGPRVIQQTIRAKLPEGFQRSEFLLEHGMVDLICHRDSLRVTVSQMLNILLPAGNHAAQASGSRH
ncbi:MAG: hypothetical protein RIQ81_593 [Pseudomonadota bacterium]|jgi:acetyl-CoA carboxylase carboxyl transferase subunit beta